MAAVSFDVRIDAATFFAMVLDHQGRINRWQTAVSSSPSICMTDFGVYPVGTSADNAYRSQCAAHADAGNGKHHALFLVRGAQSAP